MGKHVRDLAAGMALLAAAAALITLPQEAMEAARSGLALCGQVIIPSLFPYFILSSLLVELGLAACLGRLLSPVMSPLFGVSGPGASALVLGLVGGYPVGAATVRSLYESGSCSKREAEGLLTFCNNSGPAFILGVAGAGVFQSLSAGALLYAIHIAGALLTGILFCRLRAGSRTKKRCDAPPAVKAVRASSAFTRSIQKALTSTLAICAFVVCFTVLLRLLNDTGVLSRAAELANALLVPLGWDPIWTSRLLAGLLELSTGITGLTGSGAPGMRLVLAAFLLGWGGLSVHCQTAALLERSGLSCRRMPAAKLVHGLLSAALAFGWNCLQPSETAVSVFAPALAPAPAHHPPLVWGGVALLLLLTGAGLWRRRRKNSGKAARCVV